LALVFPGIGAPLCGAEREFFARHRAVMAPYLEEAAVLAGADLAAALLADTVKALDHRAQELFVHAFNCGACAAYERAGLRPAWVAGYSFGIYSALAAAGAVGFSEALALADRARTLVNEECPDRRFGMAAVLGLTEPEVRRLAGRPGRDSICLANVVNDAAVILSGLRGDLEGLLAEALRLDAFKAVLLDTDVPFHHPKFLSKSSERFRDFIARIPWREARCPVISSIDQSLLTTPDELMDFTARNLSTPISWRGVIARMRALGVEEVIECGPGVSLTRSAQFLADAPRHRNIKTFLHELHETGR